MNTETAMDDQVSRDPPPVETDDELLDYHSLCRQAGIDPRIMMVGPNTVLDFGYNIFLAVTAPKGSVTRDSAVRAVNRFTAYCECFNPKGKSGGYVTQLMMSANAFAAGIERRKKISDDRIASAKLEYDRFLQAFSQGQWVTAAAIGALKVFCAGGVAFILAFVILSNVGLSDLVKGSGEKQSQFLDPHYVSLAFAGGFGLLSAAFRGWWQAKRIREASKIREDSITAAIDWYAKEALREYQLAASTASKAWETLTRIPAPNTEAMENLLRSLLEREFRDENDKPVQAKRGWRFWKRTHTQTVSEK